MTDTPGTGGSRGGGRDGSDGRDGSEGRDDVGAAPDDGLLAAWALDAVDEDERAEVESRLSADPALRARADSLRGTVDRLATSTPEQPPAELRDRVLGAIRESTEPTGSVTDLGAERGRRRPHRSRWWVTVAGVAAAAVVAVVLVLNPPWEAPGITEQSQVTALEEVLGAEGSRHLEGAVQGGGEAEAAHDPAGETVFVARGLPQPNEGHDYQLWTIPRDGTPVSAGVLEVSDGRVLARLDDVPEGAALAVTVEPAGGSQAPTTEPVVILAAGD